MLTTAQKMLVMQRPRTVAAAAAAFAPTDIASCVGWYDASNAGSITGSPVSQWNDLSTSGFHLTQVTSGNRPVTGAHTLNSLNVLEFDGSSKILTNTSATFPVVNTATWFAVVVPSATTSFERLLAYDTGTNDFDNTSSIAAILRDNANLGMAAYYNSAEVGIKAMTNAAHVVVSKRNGDTHTMYVDGTGGTPATGLGTANFGFTQMGVGGRVGNSGGADFFAARLGELIWYSTSLSDANRNTVEAYLKAKWATP